MTELALIVSAVGSSVSAVLLGGIARWLYRIDNRTMRNHETLHNTPNGPGVKSQVREHREVLHKEGLLNGYRRDRDDG